MYKSEMRTRVKRVRLCLPAAASLASFCAVRLLLCPVSRSSAPMRRAEQVGEALAEGDYAASSSLLSKAFAILDKNVKRGIIHKNTAARKKSQFHLKVKALETGSAPAAAEAVADDSSE